MPYSINQLAKLAGVTVRTLHHYDHIDLLKPSRIQQNGYRQYDQNDLIRLQQILFFRELDFSLKEIKRIMHSAQYDQIKAMTQQKELLQLKKKRLGRLVKTIEKTITSMQNNQLPEDTELYNAFADDDVKLYQDEVKQRWGHTDAYQQSMERVGKMTKAQMEKIKRDGEAFTAKLAQLIHKGPEDAEVQTMIDQHYNALRTFYEPNLELYAGLANMYVDDPRFSAYYNKHHPDMAKFMRDAMLYYIKHRS